MSKFLNWLEERTGYTTLFHEALFERIPGGARWRYVWGSTLVFTFAVQVITGLFLWTAYSPSAHTAWESVYYIQNVMSYGWLVRGIHHFMAQAMIVLLALHFMQVVIDGAYRAPREVNFWLGLILMQIVLGLSLTGYLLPWDQKGYYATKVSTEIMGATPVVGEALQRLVQGGPAYGHHTLTRFFAMHAGILPALLVAFLGLHLHAFRRHGVTVRDVNRNPECTFWPDQVLRDAVACLAVLATVLGLVLYRGAELSAPANPAEPYSAARPEWYFLFLFRFLKYEAVEHMGLAFGAIYVPGAIMLVLFLMPVIAYIRGGHRFNVGFMWVLMAGIGYLTGLAWYEDHYASEGAEYRAAVAAADLDAERVRELAHRPEGIPPEGARALLENDPKTRGPKLFAQHCAACHSHTGDPDKASIVAKEPSAADLGRFGTREWTRNVLVNYKDHFAPLANAVRDGENVGDYFLGEDGQMLGWSQENQEVLTAEANAESVNALIEFIYSQAQRDDGPPVDAELAKQGREIFEFGELAEGTFSLSCVDCHAMHVIGEEEALGYTGSAPILTGYGGVEWLKKFIAHPDSEEFYGDNNAMPAYADQLTEQEIDMLARWLAGDYYESGGDAEE